MAGTVTCPKCNARLDLCRRLGTEAPNLWQVGNRAGLWRGCAAFFTANGRTVLCVARPIDVTWAAIRELMN